MLTGSCLKRKLEVRQEEGEKKEAPLLEMGCGRKYNLFEITVEATTAEFEGGESKGHPWTRIEGQT